MSGASPPGAAGGPPRTPQPFKVRPALAWMGWACLVAMVPLVLVISLWAGFYVPDIGYFDGGFFAVASTVGILLFALGVGLIYGSRLPLGYPAPPFPSINPPSGFAGAELGNAALGSAEPPVYLAFGLGHDGPLDEGAPTTTAPRSSPPAGTPNARFNALGYSVAPTRCPRCGWVGSVSVLVCPRCGLRGPF
jgi:hypothetical protein